MPEKGDYTRKILYFTLHWIQMSMDVLKLIVDKFLLSFNYTRMSLNQKWYLMDVEGDAPIRLVTSIDQQTVQTMSISPIRPSINSYQPTSELHSKAIQEYFACMNIQLASWTYSLWKMSIYIFFPIKRYQQNTNYRRKKPLIPTSIHGNRKRSLTRPLPRYMGPARWFQAPKRIYTS